MQGVITVVFVAWLAVALGVYAYRIWRRVTQGPKATREARAATDAGRSAALGTGSAPAEETGPGSVARPPADRPSGATGIVVPPTAADLTVAAAFHGIELPCDLVPIVDVDDASAATGRRVVFTTRSSDVPTVASALTDELGRLGYQAADAATDPSGSRRRIIATRADATVTVAVTADDTGVVTAEVST